MNDTLNTNSAVAKAVAAYTETRRVRQHGSMRRSSPGAEAEMYVVKPCLDNGFIVLNDYMGSDESIVESARVSYGEGTRSTSDNAGLVNYLLEHKHTTPFEMAEVRFHCRMPIVVARQWIRHRTANVNELSGRYSIIPSDYYIPAAKDIAMQDTKNRQGRGTAASPQEAEEFLSDYETRCDKAFATYEAFTGKEFAREISRMHLPLSTYTEWYWKNDLHNTMHFLNLRLDPHAQLEVRVYAEAMWGVIKAAFPLAAAAFQNVYLEGIHLTGKDIRHLLRMLGPDTRRQMLNVLTTARADERLRSLLKGDRANMLLPIYDV